MMILQAIIFILIGAVGVIWGADRFTDGAASLARKFNVSQMVVGLTIVAFGTSAPEMFVSLMSAIQGSTAMAVANIIGSNIFNILLIVGASAAVCVVSINPGTVRRDMPIVLLSSLLLTLLCLDGKISVLDGCVMLAGLIVFVIYMIRLGHKTPNGVEGEATEIKVYGTGRSILYILIGLLCLVVCSSLFVRGASAVAVLLGVSDVVSGLAIVAGGTSLPELATSVVAARKGQSALAIGNVVGSCIYNILFILGLTGVICPMATNGITQLDYVMMNGSVLLMWLFCYSRFRVSRGEGWIMMSVFFAYMAWIVFTA